MCSVTHTHCVYWPIIFGGTTLAPKSIEGNGSCQTTFQTLFCHTYVKELTTSIVQGVLDGITVPLYCTTVFCRFVFNL